VKYADKEVWKKISLGVKHSQNKQTDAVISAVSYTHWMCTELLAEMGVLLNCRDFEESKINIRWHTKINMFSAISSPAYLAR
jgi:hypothetical protein